MPRNKQDNLFSIATKNDASLSEVIFRFLLCGERGEIDVPMARRGVNNS